MNHPCRTKKIQLWASGISGHNCKIEYIAGPENTCADLLSRSPSNDETKDIAVGPEINDNTYEINMLNSNQFNGKEYVDCNYEGNEEIIKPKLELPELDMVQEQNKDSKLLEIKTIIKHGEPSKVK